jgi:hypothetical protein
MLVLQDRVDPAAYAEVRAFALWINTVAKVPLNRFTTPMALAACIPAFTGRSVGREGATKRRGTWTAPPFLAALC